MSSKHILRTFDGSEPANEWIRSFKISAVYHDWDEKAQIEHIQLFLLGKGLRLFKAVHPTSTSNTTIKPIFDALLVGCAKSPTFLHNQFKNRRKLANETFGQFASALYELIKAAMPDTADAQLQGMLKAQIFEGVPEHVKPLLIFDKDRSWDDIVDNLDTMYPIVNTSFDLGMSSNTASKMVEQFKVEPIEQHFMGGRAKPRTNPNPNVRFDGNCHFCHTYGHRIANCSKLAAQNGQYNSPNSNMRSNNYSNRNTSNNSYNSFRQNAPLHRDSASNYNNNSYNGDTSNYSRSRSPNSYNTSYGRQQFGNSSTDNNSIRASNMNLMSNSLGPPNGNSTFLDNSGYGTSNNSSINSLQDASSHFVMVDSNNQTFSEFPFYAHDEIENNVMELTSLTNDIDLFDLANPMLFSVNTQVKCSKYTNVDFFNATSMIDSGSSVSFIDSSLLSDSLLLELIADDSCHRTFLIKGAIDNKVQQCFLISVDLKIDSWSNEFMFVVAPISSSFKLILGNDFLKHFYASIDFSNNILEINGCSIILTCDSLDIESAINVHEVQFANYVLPSSSSLLKTIVGVCGCINGVTIDNKAIALIDCGSTHSFLSPKILTPEFFDMLKDFKECHMDFSITSATGIVQETCFVVDLELKLTGWSGMCKFVISHKAAKHDMVLGIDFLRREHVKIDHGFDRITINNNIIKVNSIDTVAIKAVHFDDDIISDNIVRVNGSIIVKSSSQRLIPVKCSSTCITTKLMYFEPQHPCPYGSLVGKSLHEKVDLFFVNIINASDNDITLADSSSIGTIHDCDFSEASNHSTLPVEVGTQASLAFVKIDEVISTLNNDIDHAVSPDISSTEQHRRFDEIVSRIKIGSKLDENQKTELLAMLVEHYDSFQWQDGPPGCTPFAVHSIPTGDTLPIVQKQYPIPTIAQEPLRQQVSDMLRDNIIRPGSGPWRSPVLLIAKTDAETGKVAYRFCIDLRKVNSATIKDAYSLPRIDESVDVLAGAKFFSSMDINRAFWQVPLLEQDKEKTGFMVEGKLYEFNVMPFGSMNAPATFQRLMDRVLNGMTWKQVLVYLDDVLLFSKLWSTHLESLRQVFSRLKTAKLKLKPSKCVFGTHTVTYLGFNISDEGICPAFNKILALIKTERPQTTKLLVSFLCAVNYYRHDIPCFGDLTADLYDMANEKRRFCSWNEKTSKNFDILKRSMSIAPILAFPDFSKQFWFQSDASMKAIGGVCLQMHDLWRPVMFFGRKLTKVERRYSTTERELLSIVYGYKICYHLVYGRKIVFQTDHQPLVTLAKLKEPFGRLGRLFHYLVDVDFEIRFIPGRQNFLADFMSRAVSENLETEDDTFTRIEVNSLQLTSSVNWAAEQSKDIELSLLKDFIKTNKNDDTWSTGMPNGLRWMKLRRQLFIYDNVLKYGSNQVIVPSQLRNLVLQWHHDTPFAGHRGAETVLVALRVRYFWLNMYSDVTDYCRSCDRCQMYNYSQQHSVAPLKPIFVSRTGQIVGLDFIGPFKTTKSGNRYAILAVDANDKFLMGSATKICDALTTAAFVMNEVICKHGMVEVILSDQAKNFESDLFKHLCALLGAHKIRSSPYHAAGNGITERVNKVIKPALAKFVDQAGDDWDVYLQMAINAYNTSFHSSIGLTPFEAHFGRPAITVADVILNNRLPPTTNPSRIHEFTLNTFERAEQLRNTMLVRKEEAQQRYKTNYDKQVGFVNDRFPVGCLVKIINFTVRPGHSKAWEQKFLGPFKVLRVFTIESENITYELFDGTSSRIVHYNRLAPYNQRFGEKIVLGKFPIYNNNDEWTLVNVEQPVKTALLDMAAIRVDFNLARKVSAKRRTLALNNLVANNVISNANMDSNMIQEVAIISRPVEAGNIDQTVADTPNLVAVTVAPQTEDLVINSSENENGGFARSNDNILLEFNNIQYLNVPQASILGVESSNDLSDDDVNDVDFPNVDQDNGDDIHDNGENDGISTVGVQAEANRSLFVDANDTLTINHDNNSVEKGVGPSLVVADSRVLRSNSLKSGANNNLNSPVVTEKTRALCIGCKKTWQGLKIHQNSCKLWLEHKKNMDEISDSIRQTSA
jgi:hypothetical protein